MMNTPGSKKKNLLYRVNHQTPEEYAGQFQTPPAICAYMASLLPKRKLHVLELAYGLKSLTSLPRATFEFARIQTCVFELERGYRGTTEFKYWQPR